MVSVLATALKVRGFKTGQGREKSAASLPSEGKESRQLRVVRFHGRHVKEPFEV
jgi:hypothetical protein